LHACLVGCAEAGQRCLIRATATNGHPFGRIRIDALLFALAHVRIETGKEAGGQRHPLALEVVAINLELAGGTNALAQTPLASPDGRNHEVDMVVAVLTPFVDAVAGAGVTGVVVVLVLNFGDFGLASKIALDELVETLETFFCF